jgi:hypothetical protein
MSPIRDRRIVHLFNPLSAFLKSQAFLTEASRRTALLRFPCVLDVLPAIRKLRAFWSGRYRHAFGCFGADLDRGLKPAFILERLRHATHPMGGCPARALIQSKEQKQVLRLR